jgi:hypothetical protein
MAAGKIGKPSPDQEEGYGTCIVDQKNRSNSNTARPNIIFENIHTGEALWCINRHPGYNSGQVADALGYTLVGSRKNWEIRKEISDCLEMLVLAKYLRKEYHRFFPLEKARSTENRVMLGSDGLPRALSFKSRFAFEDTHIPIGPRITRDAE